MYILFPQKQNKKATYMYLWVKIIIIKKNLHIFSRIYANFNPMIIIVFYWINGRLNLFECSSSMLINNNGISNMISTTVNGPTKKKTRTNEYDQLENHWSKRYIINQIIVDLCGVSSDIMNNLFNYIYLEN